MAQVSVTLVPFSSVASEGLADKVGVLGVTGKNKSKLGCKILSDYYFQSYMYGTCKLYDDLIS